MHNKVNILFSSYPDFSGNPKAFFEFLSSNYCDKFNFNWVIYNATELLSILKSKNINCVLFNSLEYQKLIEDIDIIFDTNGFLFSEKKQNQIYINQWHGFGPKKIGYLLDAPNLAPQDIEYFYKSQNKTDFIIVPSEFAQLIFSSIFNINAQRIIPSGFCRDEYILNSNGKANLQKLTTHNIYSYNKILFYLPTFRNGNNRSDSQNIFSSNLLNLNNYNERELLDYLKENNYLLVIKKHPAEEDTIKDIHDSNVLILNDSAMTNQLITLHEILNAADLLISDYSSIYVEYLLLNRPVLFLQRDKDEYLDKRGIILNSTDIWFPGPMPNTLKEFMEDIQKLLTQTDYFSAERNNFKKLMLSENKKICQTLFDFLFDSNNYTLKHKPYVSETDQLKNNLKEKECNIENLNTEIIDLKNKKNDIQEQNDTLNNENAILKSEINHIYNSKSWKILQMFQKIKLKFKRKK